MIIRSFVKFACWFPWLFKQYNDISWPCFPHRKPPMTGGAAGDLWCVRNTGNLWSGWTPLFQPSAAPSFDLLTIAQKMLKHSMMVHWCNYVIIMSFPFASSVHVQLITVYYSCISSRFSWKIGPWQTSLKAFNLLRSFQCPGSSSGKPSLNAEPQRSPGRSRCRELVTQATLNVEGKWIRSCCCWFRYVWAHDISEVQGVYISICIDK